MATLDELKSLLREASPDSSTTRLQSDAEYSAGFDIVSRGSTFYQDFLLPQLSHLLTPVFHSRSNVSVLEIGPGPKSVLGCLSPHLRQNITRYLAFEPNRSYASELEGWCKAESPFPGLDSKAEIQCAPFGLATSQDERGFDVVLFCQSMYGMASKREYVEKAMQMLKQPDGGLVIVFHRDGKLNFDGLICHQTASSPTAVVRVANNDDTIDKFASFIAGSISNDPAVRLKWRDICRASSRPGTESRSSLEFSSPTAMIAFNQHADKLPELLARVPRVVEPRPVKNPEARHQLAVIVRPTEIENVQDCVKFALKYHLSLTVLGGGHSGQCLRSSVVAVDMSAFNAIDIVRSVHTQPDELLVVVGAGCKSGDIIRRTMEQGLTVPLGARPSVGAGLWLQGGIGHLARLHGLTCDSIVGAVLVGIDSAELVVIGNVPEKHRPATAVDVSHQDELLWALKGAGTNFGVIVSVVFKTYPAPLHLVQNWVAPQASKEDVSSTLRQLEASAKRLPDPCSLDLFLYHEAGHLQLGATLYDSSALGQRSKEWSTTARCLDATLGESTSSIHADGVQLFETDMYVSSMHGGHGGGKTCAFKRCVFLRNVGEQGVIDALMTALDTRPTEMCYMHLLHGAGAVSNVDSRSTAFGCRDWEYACVVTGIWQREQDATKTARDVVQWVYDTACSLKLLGSGVYGADLGQDPRDVALAVDAFGDNRMRLARLKGRLDPHGILPFACPLPKTPRVAKLIILVTGEICAGKDYCAGLWAETFVQRGRDLRAKVKSISDATKQEYAAVTGIDLEQLLHDRAFKEQHRPALTRFYREQLRRRPWSQQEHFRNIVYNAPDVDVLFVTGMRDDAPVATLAHLAPHSKVIEVRVDADEDIKRARGDGQNRAARDTQGISEGSVQSLMTRQSWHPDLIFNNEATGAKSVIAFAAGYLLPLFDYRYQALADMIRLVDGFPKSGVDFRHVLGIAQQPGGLRMCTNLIEDSFGADWSKIDAIVSCESGGYVFSSPLAARKALPLVLIREAGKLPPPTISTEKDASHISALDSEHTKDARIEMDRNAIPRGGSVVVVDDVLATGRTLVGILQLLREGGIEAKDITVVVVAEFPLHQGRHHLRQRGFGDVRVQSLLIFGGT